MKGRERAIEILMEMSESTSAEGMLDYLIVNYLSGSQAYEAMKSMKEEFYGEDEDEDEDADEKELREIKRIEEDEEEEDYNSALLYGVDNNQ